jgi:hypothetical protein
MDPGGLQTVQKIGLTSRDQTLLLLLSDTRLLRRLPRASMFVTSTCVSLMKSYGGKVVALELCGTPLQSIEIILYLLIADKL